jgi:hypothetical protein
MINEDIVVKRLRKPAKLGPANQEMEKAWLALKLHRQAQELFARWPNLRTSSERLTSLLTIHWPDYRTSTHGSLLLSSFKQGIAHSEKILALTHDDVAEQAAFISQVSEELSHYAGTKLMIKKNKKHWVAYNFNTHGLMESLINDNPIDELEWVQSPMHSEKSKKQLMLLCASKVFSMHELRLAGLLD